MATRNLLVRAGFDASGMRLGVRQGTRYLNDFGRNANSAMSGLSNSMGIAFAGMGKLIAGAFAIRAIANFGKQCIDLGSDLAEVQNVVDVTFGSMSEDINEFAKTAITSFGMGETAAKRYTGTMGAMLKSSGITTAKAAEMSTTLTRLAGDIASFYNISNEDAFTKIRAGIAGEIMPLRQLGINMTVASLEAYALSKGIQKSYEKMSQAEQTLLRYNYLLSVTGDAQGDFTRTSDSWANQTRVLSEQFNALKATLGQSFIVLFTPIVQALNTIVLRLQQAANYFNVFVEAAFGAQEVAKGAGLVKDEADAASDSIGGIGDSTEEAVKTAKKALAGFDEVNTLGSNAEGTDLSDALGDVSAEDISLAEMPDNTTKAAEDVAKLSEILKPVKDLVVEMGKSFKDGFVGALNGVDLGSIKSGLDSIGKSLKNIFTDKDVQKSAKEFALDFSNAVGKALGNTAKVGINFADGLVNGIATGLDAKKNVITERLTSFFSSQSKIAISWGNIFDDLGDISSVLSDTNAKRIWSSITQTLIEAFTGTIDIASIFGADLMSGIATILNNNKEGLRTAFDNTFGVIATVFETIQGSVENTMNTIYSVYNDKIKPAIENFTDLFSELARIILDAYNEHIAPTFQACAEIVDSAFKEHVQPAINAVIDTLGTFLKCVSDILVHFTPVYDFLATLFAPFLSGTFKIAFQMVVDVISILFDLITDLLQIFKGLLEFITGVFTGDWNRAWEGIKTAFGGVWKFIEDTVMGILTAIENKIKGIIKLGEDMALSLQEATGQVKREDNDLGKFQESFSPTSLDALKKMSDSSRQALISSWRDSGRLPSGAEDEAANWIMSLPHYANGGIIDREQLAVLGEGGKKEAVIPLENSGFIDTLASAIGNSVMAAMQFTSKGSSASEPIFEIDGTRFARAIMPSMLKEFERMGVRLA